MKRCLGNSEINSIPDWRAFLLNKHKSLRVQQARPDIIHSNRKIKEIFDPEKLTFSINSEDKSAWKSPGSSSLAYSLPSLLKIRKSLSHKGSHHFWSRNVTTYTREPTTRAWSSANIWRQDGAICSKNRKIVPYHGPARIPRLMVSVPDCGSWSTILLSYDWILQSAVHIHHTSVPRLECLSKQP